MAKYFGEKGCKNERAGAWYGSEASLCEIIYILHGPLLPADRVHLAGLNPYMELPTSQWISADMSYLRNEFP